MTTATPKHSPYRARIAHASRRTEGAKFCYPYDPSVTRWDPIDGAGVVHVPPRKLEIADPTTYLQPWSGYVPVCELEEDECAKLPAQTSNIKVEEVYAGVEVQSNEWMDMACEEALISAKSGGGPFGAVLLQIDNQSQKVIRYWRNHNHVALWNDPTAHAEVTTIRAACMALEVFDLGHITSKDKAESHCVIYSSAEPCPMCLSAIAWARIPTLYFAATRYDAAQEGVRFSDEDIYNELNKSYAHREMQVFQCTTKNSLDAFNYWKRSKKTPY